LNASVSSPDLIFDRPARLPGFSMDAVIPEPRIRTPRTPGRFPETRFRGIDLVT
jgi:hypothetical protein